MRILQVIEIMGAGWGLLGIAMRIRRIEADRQLVVPVVLLLFSLTMPLLEGVFRTLGWSEFPGWNFLFRIRSYPFLYGPLLWWYTRRIIGLSMPPWPRFSVHFLLFLFWAAVALSGGLQSPVHGDGPDLMVRLHGISNALSLLVYGVVVLRLLRRHNLTLEDRFADNSGDITLHWLRRLVFLYMFCFGGAVVLVLFHRHFFHLVQLHPLQIHSLIITAWLFFLQLHLHRQPQLGFFSDSDLNNSMEETQPEDSAVKEKYRNSGVNREELQAVLVKLDTVLQEQHCYLDPDLTLESLALLSGIRRHYISQALNELRNENFYFYINRHRLQSFEAAVAGERWPNLTLLGIAMECGFKSSSSFYNAVRKIYHTTPARLAEMIRNGS